MKLLMHSAYMRFCEKVSCQSQTVHGQPQDWKLVPEELG